jgi:hypothetical protein
MSSRVSVGRSNTTRSGAPAPPSITTWRGDALQSWSWVSNTRSSTQPPSIAASAQTTTPRRTGRRHFTGRKASG